MFYQYISALAFLIGNKSDLERSVTKDSVVDFAEAHGFEGAFDMSAKTGAFNLTFCLFFFHLFIHSFIHSVPDDKVLALFHMESIFISLLITGHTY